MKRPLIVTATVLTLAAGVGPLNAQQTATPAELPPMGERGHGHGRGPHDQQRGGPEGMLERLLDNTEIAEKLQLSEEQIQTIREKLQSFKEQGKALHEKLREAGSEQAKLMMKEDFSEEELMQAVEKTGEIRTEIAKLRMQPLLLLRKTLTEEQQAVIREHFKERREDFRKSGRGRDHDSRRGDKKTRQRRRPGDRDLPGDEGDNIEE